MGYHDRFVEAVPVRGRHSPEALTLWRVPTVHVPDSVQLLLMAAAEVKESQSHREMVDRIVHWSQQ
jgi:hypothetical protein